MKKHREVKFVQISTLIDYREELVLFALDEHGRVWRRDSEWSMYKNPVETIEEDDKSYPPAPRMIGNADF